MLKIWQIPTHLNGRKSSCAKVNLSLSTQQQRSFLRCKRWNFTKLLLEWPGLKLGLTSYLPIERKEVFAATDRGFTARRRLRLRLSPQTHSHFGKDTQDAMSRFFLVKTFYSSRRRRRPWCQHPPDPRDDRPQRDHWLCHRQRRLKDRRNQVDFQTRSLVKAPPYSLPNTSQMIWVTQKTPGKLEPGTICHIVLPATAVNIRMICDTHVQQGGTNIDQ